MAKLVIQTELNTDKFEKQLNDLEKKASNKEIDIDITSKELSNAESKLNSINNKLDERIAREKQIKASLKEENARQYKSSSLITMYEEQLSTITNEQLKLYDAWNKQNLQVDKLTGKLERQKNDLSEIQNKIKNAKTEQIQENINNISKGLKGIVKNVVRWGLAIFSIRSAYMLVRNAINTISQDDEQLKADIDYMKNTIAYILEPVVRKVVEWAKQLVFYIGYLIKAWTGHDIFASANKNLQKANSSAKELRKTIAGFDEKNILNDDGSVGIGGISPSFDFSSFNGDVPKWIKWIGDNKDNILAAISAMAGALIALKLTGLDPIFGILGALMGLGLYTLISGILEMIKEPSWEAFGKVLQGIGIIIADIGVILMALGVASGPIGWIIIAIGSLIGLIGTLGIELTKNRDGIKSVEEATNDLNDAKLALANETANYTRAIKEEKDANEKLAQVMRETGIDAEELYKKVYDGTLKYQDLSETQQQVYDAYIELLQAQGRVEASSQELEKAKTEEIKKSIEVELANSKQQGSYEKLKEKVIDAYKSGRISAEEASKYISKAMSTMSYDTMKAFTKDIPSDIKSGLDPYKYKTAMDRFKSWWNGEIEKFNREIKLQLTIPEMHMDIYAYSTGKKMFAKGGVYYPKLPKLAPGGIINQPGRGVPLSSAIGGERGAEGVIPLTDSQQMALLGEAIGRYVNINATVPVYVGNRMVVREMKRINAEDNFAYNR